MVAPIAANGSALKRVRIQIRKIAAAGEQARGRAW